MGFEVQTAVSIKITTLLEWTQCSLVCRCQYFAGEPTSPHPHSCYFFLLIFLLFPMIPFFPPDGHTQVHLTVDTSLPNDTALEGTNLLVDI